MNYLIFPVQIFYDIKKYLKKDYNIFLIEEPIYFTEYKFHKLKLAYHRATMKKFYDYLVSKKYNVKYIEFHKVNNEFYSNLKNITFMNPVDHKLVNKLKKLCDCNILDTELFLLTEKEIIENKNNFNVSGNYRNDRFYKFMRKKLDILMKDDKPIGNKWSYDTENREPLPDEIKINNNLKVINNKYTKDAIIYIDKYFQDNYGSLDNFIYPIDHKSTLKHFKNFLKTKLKDFGPYQDAMSQKDPFIFHSILSPMMNIGLITDKEVVEISYNYYNKHKMLVSSFEGFIRQIIGWRNYAYMLYILESDNMYKSNNLNNTNKIKNIFWDKIGIEPIDYMIEKVKKYAYLHHIERLMVLGNFMLLCNIDPKEVYRMFMEWTIDAYAWVMIFNVFSMSQGASKIGTTRLYFSSSVYILKMSDFNKNIEWTHIWDALYYSFINKHEKILSKNYMNVLQVRNWGKKTTEEKKELLSIANKFINKLLKIN